MTKVYAPASIGNVSVGFDVLGAALLPVDGTLLGDTVNIRNTKYFSITTSGRFGNTLPVNIENNIVFYCWQQFCKKIGKQIPVAIELDKNIPVSSGLGSSACSVVATLLALNIHYGKPLNNEELLLLMGKMEEKITGELHLDNVAPSFLGGMQLILKVKNIISQSIPIFSHWLWIIAYPGSKINTSLARKILPIQYSLKDCISHSCYLAGFIHACHTKQDLLAVKCIKDIIAEPYRIKKLIPSFPNIRYNLCNIGALACGISGSGPTLFAICDKNDIAIQIVNWLQQHYMYNPIKGFIKICQLDTTGARVIFT